MHPRATDTEELVWEHDCDAVREARREWALIARRGAIVLGLAGALWMPDAVIPLAPKPVVVAAGRPLGLLDDAFVMVPFVEPEPESQPVCHPGVWVIAGSRPARPAAWSYDDRTDAERALDALIDPPPPSWIEAR